jgi:N-acetylglutamate synthase-like GNAT family acetyltransferase
LLRSLAVHPDYRRQGVGAHLVQGIIAHARQLGVRDAVILTQTVEQWAARFGFEKVPRESVDPLVAGSWEFQTIRCQAAVCMRLYLSEC